MKLNSLFATALLSVVASTALADSDISVMHPTAFETAPTAMAGGGFMQIMNMGDTDDMLIAAQADYPRVEIHTTEFTDGVAKMIHVDGVRVPAGGMVALEPGGYHVMFMGLRGKPFKIGDMIPVTLVFEHAGDVDIMLEVVARTITPDENAPMDHGEMDHSND